MVAQSWLYVAEVVELSFGPCSLATWVALLSARYLSKKPFQLTGQRFAPSLVPVGVCCTELGVSALSTLGKDFSDRRLPISFMEAVESCLPPALLRL